MKLIHYLYENLGTIVVLFCVAALIFALVFKLIKDKKHGKSSCSCGCSSCPMKGNCTKSE